MVTTHPDILETLSVFAVKAQGTGDSLYISDPSSLPGEESELAVNLLESTEQQSQAEARWVDNEGNWQYGSFTEAIAVVRNQGTVVLLSDVSLTDGITISKLIIITSEDENNPCTIKNTSQDNDDKEDIGRIFTITGGELRLQNIILDGGSEEGVTACHPLICVNDQNTPAGYIRATPNLRLYDGTVLQNAENVSESMCGGGINIRRGCVYMADNSQITNCKARHGGGVEINSNATYMEALLQAILPAYAAAVFCARRPVL